MYLYPRKDDKLPRADFFQEKKCFIHFPILDRKYKKIFDEDLKNLEIKLYDAARALKSGKTKFKIFIDFENTASDENLDQIILLKKKLREKFIGSLNNQIYSFNINYLSNELIEKLRVLGGKFITLSLE
jgi:hypothetical protein